MCPSPALSKPVQWTTPPPDSLLLKTFQSLFLPHQSKIQDCSVRKISVCPWARHRRRDAFVWFLAMFLVGKAFETPFYHVRFPSSMQCLNKLCWLLLSAFSVENINRSIRLCKISKIMNAENDNAIKFIWIAFALLYVHVCAYASDQLPPTLALLIKVLSIVTHSNANSGMLTHTYHTPPAQVVSDF